MAFSRLCIQIHIFLWALCESLAGQDAFEQKFARLCNLLQGSQYVVLQSRAQVSAWWLQKQGCSCWLQKIFTALGVKNSPLFFQIPLSSTHRTKHYISLAGTVQRKIWPEHSYTDMFFDVMNRKFAIVQVTHKCIPHVGEVHAVLSHHSYSTHLVLNSLMPHSQIFNCLVPSVQYPRFCCLRHKCTWRQHWRQAAGWYTYHSPI